MDPYICLVATPAFDQPVRVKPCRDVRLSLFHYVRTVTEPMFSIVMPSYLGDYNSSAGPSATNRVEKFIRAVDSVLAQTFGSWELLIVADGCEKT